MSNQAAHPARRDPRPHVPAAASVANPRMAAAHPATAIQPAKLVLLAAAGLLAAEPIRWLIETWRDPAYDSHGALVMAAVVALAAWSASSPISSPASIERRDRPAMLPLVLIVTAALSRLAGQVLAINTLGALTLVLDVYALALVGRLDQRRRAVSPAWLAVMFAFALPLERIVQRSIGHLLQVTSADGACAVLGVMFSSLRCEGVRIVLDGRDVLVDLPCSGARTALLSLLAMAIAASLARPGLISAALGLAMTLTAAYAANVARIAVLAVGIAHPESIGGIDVMAAPWHDAVGAAALALALVPIVIWVRHCSTAPEPAGQPVRRVWHVLGVAPGVIPERIHRDGWWLDSEPKHRQRSWRDRIGRTPSLVVALAALAVAGAIVTAPRKPVDVARRESPIAMPGWISGHQGNPIEITAREQAYFTQYGGAATKMRYGPHTLMVIRTSSPLRHLHAPDECLRGLGFSVRYVGLQLEPAPTAVYHATAPDGAGYRIDVTFLADSGILTSNVAGAVWHWLNGEARTWTAIQRISPIEVEAGRHLQWSSAALTAIRPIPPARSLIPAINSGH